MQQRGVLIFAVVWQRTASHNCSISLSKSLFCRLNFREIRKTAFDFKIFFARVKILALERVQMTKMNANQATKFKVCKFPRGRSRIVTPSLTRSWISNWCVGLMDMYLGFGWEVRKPLCLTLYLDMWESFDDQYM